jgi:hypothetical protein
MCNQLEIPIMAKHPEGNPAINRQHIEKQREGDEELEGGRTMSQQEEEEGAKTPGQFRPGREAGVGVTKSP